MDVQKTKYFPELSLHIVGSWTAVFPVTTPGPTTAYPSVAKESKANTEEKRMLKCGFYQPERPKRLFKSCTGGLYL
jgi:hypothetical protein